MICRVCEIYAAQGGCVCDFCRSKAAWRGAAGRAYRQLIARAESAAALPPPVQEPGDREFARMMKW